MGLPSGTRRTMRIDLTGKFLTSDHHVRIVTNLCAYWDQVFFSLDDAPAPAPAELPLLSADLHYRGFSTPASDPEHHRPDSFDYENVLAIAPWNPMLGKYTRYGPVDKLLTRADDQLVVMAPGDELTVAFDAAKLPPLPGRRTASPTLLFPQLSGRCPSAEWRTTRRALMTTRRPATSTGVTSASI
jgi:hypothetical protein